MRTFAPVINQLISSIMAKFYGPIVKSGKVGGSVFKIRHGETIESQYQPVVFNPSTKSQRSTRVAFGLLVQVARSLASIIGFRRLGNASPRNRFVSANFANVNDPIESGGEIKRDISVTSIDLTGGAEALPMISTPSVAANVVTVSLESAAAAAVSRVLYALVGVKEDSQLFVLDTVVAETPGVNRLFESTLTLPAGASGNFAIFAYGMIDVTDEAYLCYELYKTASDPVTAMKRAVQSLSTLDAVLTETKCVVFTQA